MSQPSGPEPRIPKVSVIIAAYNYDRFLGEAIESVLHQTFEDWDLVVVDDGSTDSTSDVVGSFQDSRIRYVYQENRGHAGARNRGIQESSGVYIAFLDADDLWLPHKLEKQVAQLDILPERVGLVYADMDIIDDANGQTLGHYFRGRVPPRGNIFSDLVRREWGASGPFLYPSTVMLRREVLKRSGLFDDSLKARTDWEMWVRIAAVCEVDLLEEALAIKREHARNLHKNNERLYRYAGAACLKVLNNFRLESVDRRALRRSLARLHFERSLSELHKGKRREGLAALLEALRAEPMVDRAYSQTALLLLSPRMFRWLRDLKHRKAA